MGEHVAFEAWQHDLNGICGHYFGDPHRGREAIHGRVAVRQVCELDAADISGDVEAIRRDERGIRRDEAEHVFALFQLSGTLNVRHNGQRTRLGAGQALLLDSTRIADLGFPDEGCRFLSLHMPRQTFLDARAGRMRIGTAMARDHPLSWAIWRQVGAVLDGRGSEEVTEASSDLLLGMIQLAFAMDPEAASTKLGCDGARFDHAIQFLEANLTREDLSADWLAQRMGLSVRHLQRLFQENDAAIASVIREKRLRLAAEHLARAARRDRVRVSEAAFAAGFRDVSAFHRSFKSAFGETPRAYAQRAARG